MGARADRSLAWLERSSYLAVGFLIIGAIGHNLLAVAWTVGRSLVEGSEPPLLPLLDRVLFVLMLVEILHTVRVSLGATRLVIETFLAVGVIASIRRILVITLGEGSAPVQSGSINWTALAEIIVLAAMILVLVVGVYLLRRGEDRLE